MKKETKKQKGKGKRAKKINERNGKTLLWGASPARSYFHANTASARCRSSRATKLKVCN